MIQLSVLKITGYGPWTLTLGSDREHELQALQASMYGKLQGLFSAQGCLAFLNRADEFFVVSNGLDLQGHAAIQDELRGTFEVKLDMSIGCGATPFAANKAAHAGRVSGIALDHTRDIYGKVCDAEQSATVMHLDVDCLTSRNESDSPYEVSAAIFGLYSKMSSYFMARDSLAFFMGGDNFMVVSGQAAKDSVRDFVDVVEKDGIKLNCGIGTASTGRQAAMLATKSLDAIREMRDSGGEHPRVYELPC